MTKKSSKMFFMPPNPKVKHVFDRLTQYPNVEVDPELAQTISRYKKIRYLSSNDNILIRKGLIVIPRKAKVRRNGNGFDFFYP